MQVRRQRHGERDADGGSGREARCTAPVDATLAAEWDSTSRRTRRAHWSSPSTGTTRTARSPSRTCCTRTTTRRVQRLARLPLGGPLGGGTLVSVYLTDDRLLVDLGGGQRGLYCKFSYEEEVGELGHKVVETKTIRVDAELADCGGARVRPGWGSITCQAPRPLDEITRDGDARDVRVEVTVNGQNYTDGGVLYRYYDDTAWRIHLPPARRPARRQHLARRDGHAPPALGDVRRYGVLNLQVNATVVASTEIACVSPPHWRWRASPRTARSARRARAGRTPPSTVDLEITLNGQDYLPYLPHTWTYSLLSRRFPLRRRRAGRAAQRRPSGGGTLVDVTGVGFVDRGNIPATLARRPRRGRATTTLGTR